MFTFEIKLKMCIVVISNLNRIALWEVKVLQPDLNMWVIKEHEKR